MAKFYDEFLHTTITDNPDVVAAWVSVTDSIWRSRLRPFSVGIIYRPAPIASLRVCFGPHCLVYKLPQKPPIPEPLRFFLVDSLHTFVGPEVESNLETFGRDYGICPDDMDALNLGIAAATLYQRSYLKGASVKQIAALVLDQTVELSTNIFKRTLDKGEEVEIRKNLGKAMDAMLDLETEIDNLHKLTGNLDVEVVRRLMSAEVEYDCINAFVYFCLGEFLQGSQFDQQHIYITDSF